MLDTLKPLTSHAAQIGTIDYLMVKPSADEQSILADGWCRDRRVWLHMEAPYNPAIKAPMCLHKFDFFSRLYGLSDVKADNFTVETVVEKGKAGSDLISKITIVLSKTRIEYQCVDPTIVNFIAPKGIKSTWEATASLTPEDVEEFKKVLQLQNIMLRGKDGVASKTPNIKLTTVGNKLNIKFPYLDSKTELVLTDTCEGAIGDNGIELDATEFALLMDIVKNDQGGLINLSNVQIQIMTTSDDTVFYMNTRQIQTKGNSYASS